MPGHTWNRRLASSASKAAAFCRICTLWDPILVEQTLTSDQSGLHMLNIFLYSVWTCLQALLLAFEH